MCTLRNDVALAARNVEKLEDLSIQAKASLHKCDASKIDDVNRLFEDLDEKLGIPELVVYNPSARLRGAIETLDPEKTKEALNVTCFGAFLVAQQAAKGCLSEVAAVFFSQVLQQGLKVCKFFSFCNGKIWITWISTSISP